MSRNWPQSADKPEGMAIGIYLTRDDAALAALEDIMDLSIATDEEWGGRIWIGDGNGFGYSRPVCGNGDHVDPALSPLPEEAREVGSYHTHGAYTTVGGVDPVTGEQLGPIVRFVPREEANHAGQAFGRNLPVADFWSPEDIAVFRQLGRTIHGYRAYLGTAQRIVRYFDVDHNDEGIVTARTPRRIAGY